MNMKLMLNSEELEGNAIISEPPIIKKEVSSSFPTYSKDFFLLHQGQYPPIPRPQLSDYWSLPFETRQALGKDLILSYLERYSTTEAVYAVGRALFSPFVSLLETAPDACLFFLTANSTPAPFVVEFQLEKYLWRLTQAVNFYRTFIGKPLRRKDTV